MNIISAKILWENGTLVGACDKSMALNCAGFNMGSIREAWLVRGSGGCCGGADPDNPQVVFQDPNDENALHGIWVESGDRAMVLDAAAVSDVTDACNACCGDAADTTVTPVYDGTIPDVTEDGTSAFCITRSDNGSYYAIQTAMLDYIGKYETMRHKSSAGGVSKYDIIAFEKPVPVGTDAVATGACA